MDASCKIPSRRPRSIVKSAVLILTCVWWGGCSGLPHLVILHDPLTPQEHVDLGRSYERHGKKDLAMAQYKAALKVQKNFLPALEALGDMYASGHRFREAERIYQRILRIEPEQPRIMNNLGWIYSLQGVKMEKGEQLIRKAIEVDPAQKAYYLDTLAGLYIRMKNIEKAVKALHEARAAAAQDPRLEASLEEKFNLVRDLENLFSAPTGPFQQKEFLGDPR